jgi:hypothetical protein
MFMQYQCFKKSKKKIKNLVTEKDRTYCQNNDPESKKNNH